MSYDRSSDRIAGPMTTGQAHTLRRLAVEAYQEKQFQPGLSRAEAAAQDRPTEAGDQSGELILTIMAGDNGRIGRRKREPELARGPN